MTGVRISAALEADVNVQFNLNIPVMEVDKPVNIYSMCLPSYIHKVGILPICSYFVHQQIVVTINCTSVNILC